MENDAKLDRVEEQIAALEQYVVGDSEAWNILLGYLDLDRERWLLTRERDGVA